MLAVEEAEAAQEDGQKDEEGDDSGGENQAVHDGEAAITVGLLDEGEGFKGDDREDAGHDVEDEAAEEGEEENDRDRMLLGLGIEGGVGAGVDQGELLVIGEEGDGAAGTALRGGG